MRLLLDTHALLWWLGNSDRLGQRARALIADPSNDVLFSVASLWEAAVKARTGKLHVDVGRAAAQAERSGLAFLGISVAHLLKLQELPMHHRDPFDHLLIAQAIVEDAVFVSEDRHTPRYPVRSLMCSA